MTPAGSIVIASRDRPDLLVRCLAALAAQESGRTFEVIVVDDGSRRPLSADPRLREISGSRASWSRLSLLRGAGEGPARARNRGIAAAAGDVLLFTDDDTVPAPAWVDAALTWLDEHPEAVGVEGPTVSVPFDPLYEHSIHAPAGGHLTCNIAYRRRQLAILSGFSEAFPHPHAEDLDLGLRALELGPIGFCSRMRVQHPPRPVTLRSLIRRGRYVESEILLMHRHWPRHAGGWPRTPTQIALVGIPRRAARYARAHHQTLRRRPRAVARLAAVVAGQLAVGAGAVLRSRRGAIGGARAPLRRLGGIAREWGGARLLARASRPRYRLDVVWYRALRFVRLPRRNSGRTIELADGTLLDYRLNRGDIQAIREVWLGEAYRPLVEAGTVGVVVDLGANIGFTSVYFARRCGARRIVAVEPDPENARILRRNLVQNGIEASVLEAAVGPRDGTAYFARAEDSNLGRLADDGTPVNVLSMPSVLRELGGSAIDLLKVDIEGGEEGLFSGDLSWLDQVRTLMVEFHDVVDGQALVEAICARGFRHLPARDGRTDAFVRQVPAARPS